MAFTLGDVFKIYSPKKRFNANTVHFGGKYPYVARGSSNNGIRGYITEDECYLSPAKSLSFGQDTATVFYQPDAYFTGDKIKVMVLRNHELNDELAQYFITVIMKAFSAFAWGQSSFNEKILKATKIILPIIETPDHDHKYTVNDIDYGYMQERITELEQERIAELDAYLAASGLDDYELTEEDKEVLALSQESTSDEAGASEADCEDGQVRFKEFEADELFEIRKGKRLTKADMKPGGINFIGSTSGNNGVTAKIGNTEHLHPAHTITVSYNGSVGEVFLQDEPFWASDDVNVWYPKIKVDDLALLYIMTLIKKLSAKYSYTAKWTIDKMRAEKLSLPIIESPEPDHDYTVEDIDFDYMKRYTRAIEKLAIADAVKYKNKVIETTKKVLNGESEH